MNTLNQNETRILFALAAEGYKGKSQLRQRQLSYNGIRERSGLLKGLSAAMIEESHQGNVHPESLEARGLIEKLPPTEAGSHYGWQITPEGLSALRATVAGWDLP